MKTKTSLLRFLALSGSLLAAPLIQAQTTTYTGDNATNNDRWNNPANWDNGVPTGAIDVIIPDGKTATAWSNATPSHSGDISVGVNSQVRIGFTSVLPLSYNALGTPGSTTITLASGAGVVSRSGGTVTLPAINLLGNALVLLGDSTQTPMVANFNHPVTGFHQFTVQSNGQGSNPTANFNVSNGFSSMVIQDIAGRGNPADTFRANIADSLGLGDVSILSNGALTTNRSPMLWVSAPHAMSILGTLSITGGGTTNAGTNKLRLDENMTVAGLVLDGVPQTAGTYGKADSGADFEATWLNTSGNGILTVETPNVAYWDINNTGAGAGGATPGGTWNNSNILWNPDADGTGSTAAWTAGQIAVFSAGSDATGTYNVGVAGSQDISGIIVHNGSVNLTEGTGGALRLVNNSNLNIVLGSTSSIATNIGEDASVRALSKSGGGTLTVSGDLSHTGGTSLLSGNLVLSGANSAATGGTSIANGILQVNSAGSIPGTLEDLTVSAAGTLVFGPSFGSGNVQTALNNRIVTSSAGVIAADSYAATNIDFGAAGLSAAFLGAVGNVNYTGTLTPSGGAYRLGGGGGTLTMGNAIAVTGANALIAKGKVVLAGNNDYTGATTVNADASLSLLGSTTTSGVTLNTGSTLTIGNNSSLGGGTLTIAGAATIQPSGTVVTTNPVAANADFTIGGAGALTFGTVTVNNNRIIGNSAATTIGAIGVTSGNRALTFNSIGDTTITGDITTGSGTLAKNDPGTLTLGGANTYSGTTTVSGGTLVLSGSNNSAGATILNAATLQLNSNSNGGLASGQITISSNDAVLQAINADRVIANNVLFNSSATISGSQSLTINGSLRLNNNRTLTNSIAGTGKLLTVAAVDRTDTNNRNLTVTGAGDTIVTGTVDLGTGTLIKSGTGKLTLSGTNTYEGNTTVNTGGTLALVGGSQNSAITVNSGAFLGFTLGSSTTSSKALNLNTGHAIRITGTPTLASYTLITAASIGGTGTPTLEAPIGGYELVVDGTSLKLNSTGASGNPYDTWKAVNAPSGNPDDDFDGDGVSNAVEFVLGGDKNSNDLGKLPAAATSGGNMTFTFVRDQASIDPSTIVQVEVGTTLASWLNIYNVGTDTAGSSAGIAITKNTPVAGKDTVTLTVAQAPDTKKFARLKVVITP